MPKYRLALRNNRNDEITAAIDGATGAGTLKVYGPATGSLSVPAGPSAANPTGTLELVSHTLTDPAAPASSAGVLSFSAIADGTPSNSGIPQWARLLDAGGTAHVQFTAGTTGTEVIVSASPIVTGTTVSVTTRTITEGNG